MMMCHEPRRHRSLSQRLAAFLIAAVCAVGLSSVVHAESFQQTYARGKVLLKQKLYADAAKAFRQAIQSTSAGKAHFGAHYFLGLARYRLIKIDAARTAWQQAAKLARNATQKQAVAKMQLQLTSLFGKLELTPMVDPDAVGRLKVRLKPSSAFSHPQKRRVFRILQKRWMQQGLVLTQTQHYLPRGSYQILIMKDQCLQYGFAQGQGGKVTTSIQIDASPVKLSIVAKASCKCEGGQVPKKLEKGYTCVCPEGTAWAKSTKRCEIPKKQRSWMAKNWPWVTAVGVAAVGGGVVLTYFLVTANADPPRITFSGKPF